MQCGLSEWCNVNTRTTCNLHVEKRICLPLVPVQLLPGSLIEVFIHFNAVEDDDESSLFQQPESNRKVYTSLACHEDIKCRTWPEPNEDLHRLLQEAEDEEIEAIAPLIGQVILDNPAEWTRLAIDMGQYEPMHIRVVVHGLMYERGRSAAHYNSVTERCIHGRSNARTMARTRLPQQNSIPCPSSAAARIS